LDINSLKMGILYSRQYSIFLLLFYFYITGPSNTSGGRDLPPRVRLHLTVSRIPLSECNPHFLSPNHHWGGEKHDEYRQAAYNNKCVVQSKILSPGRSGEHNSGGQDVADESNSYQ
jgi:hypothetical protein